jgi:hypothetical protein
VRLERGLFITGLMWWSNVEGAQLKPETIAAWDHYIESVNANMQDRLRPGGGPYLWMDQDAGRVDQVQRGEIVTAPVGPHAPINVHSGLIHHWIGTAFIPEARLNDVLAVVRDYSRYKEYFKPNVADARLTHQDSSEDQFSMRLMNKAIIIKTAIDSEYVSTYVPLDERRAYSISRTTRVQEIEDLGRASEHRLAVGEGGGYIWRFYSVTRYLERDGGVYMEVEAIALSREIPGSLKWVVEPYVRRLSRESIITSLRQTGDAVRGTVELTRSKPPVMRCAPMDPCGQLPPPSRASALR